MREVIDEAVARKSIAAHARALQAGDLEGAAACLDDDFDARWEAILAQLPPSIHYVELAQLEHVDGAIVALVRYSGDKVQTTIEQRWEVRRGRAMIVDARLCRPVSPRRPDANTSSSGSVEHADSAEG